MNDKTLLASVVLFRELYESDKDIYDVIAEFIKTGLLFSKKWTTNTTDTATTLQKEFGLSIPEAVISTTLNKRLCKRDKILDYDKGQYTANPNTLSESEFLVEALENLKDQQSTILEKLYDHIKQTKKDLDEREKEDLKRSFCDYLFDSDSSSMFSEEISAFILKNKNTPGIKEQLNSVREGFVLYDGVRHTPDLNNISTWRENLTAYLDTEYLFDATGLNGNLRKQLFKDFFTLSGEVKSKGNRLIHLQYFNESIHEAERFFHVAELIVQGRATLDPSKPAMINIIDGCRQKGDIAVKKAKFINELRNLGITENISSASDLDYKYNLESQALLETIREDFRSKGRDLHEDKCINTLRMLSKVNHLRKGKSNVAFEAAGHILVSESYLANYLSFHHEIRENNGGIPLATDLEFITNRLWFKLHKGLAKGFITPQSLNVIAKAQVVLSSQLNKSISTKYHEIEKDYKLGKLQKPVAQQLLNELRTNTRQPENLSPENIDSALEFLDHTTYQDHIRENSKLIEAAEEGKRAVHELALIKRSTNKSAITKIAKNTKNSYYAASLAAILSIPAISYLIYRAIETLATDQDSLLAKSSLFVTIAIGIAPLIKAKAIAEHVNKKCKNSIMIKIRNYRKDTRRRA